MFAVKVLDGFNFLLILNIYIYDNLIVILYIVITIQFNINRRYILTEGIM